ncbi:MAG: AAA family ATPase, partial [Pseudomonadota bacterium]
MPRRRRRSRPLPANTSHSISEDALYRLLRLWSLRVLVPLGGLRELISTRGFMSDSINQLIDLEDLMDPADPLELDPQAVTKNLKKQYLEAEQAAANTPLPDRLRQNLQRLGATLSLSDIECQLLGFTALLHSENALEEVCELRGSLSSNEVIRTLSVILDLPTREVRKALGANSALTRSGLLRLDRTGDGRLSHKLDMLSPQFADCLCSTDAEALHLLREIIREAPEGKLAMDDYPHLDRELSLLLPYMKERMASEATGVNILLYGAPGTGKTELARMLARQIGTPLYEIANADEEGDPVRGDRRLRALRTAQQVLAQQEALLLFDEIEDVFGGNAPLFGQLALGQQLKGWVNRTLEENPVPTLWVSNEIRDMDPAFLRRFCMVVEVPMPPRSQRQRMIGQYAPDTLSG